MKVSEVKAKWESNAEACRASAASAQLAGDAPMFAWWMEQAADWGRRAAGIERRAELIRSKARVERLLH